jgi:hypothetical protein
MTPSISHNACNDDANIIIESINITVIPKVTLVGGYIRWQYMIVTKINRMFRILVTKS